MFENRLKTLRQERGWGQIDVANALNLPCNTYRNYEVNDREPPLKLLVEIARLYNVSVDWLLGNSDVRNINNAETPQNFGEIIDVLCRQLTRLEKESEVNPENLPRLTEAMCNIVSCLTTLSLSDIAKKT